MDALSPGHGSTTRSPPLSTTRATPRLLGVATVVREELSCHDRCQGLTLLVGAPAEQVKQEDTAG
jgi:hypothetical protein